MRQGHRVGVAATIVLGFLLSGCAGSDPTSAAASKTTAPTEIHGSEGTSTISGRILDEETRPLSGVQVLIATRSSGANQSELSTNAAGQFTVTGLAAGDYVVYTRKLGYYDAPPKHVALAEGDAQNVTIVLKPLPQLVPSQLTMITRHNFTNSFCLVVPGVTTACGVQVYSGGGAPKTIDADENVRGDLQTVVLQSRWPATIGACPGYFRTDLYSPGEGPLNANFPSLDRAKWSDSNPFHWDNIPESFRSPTRLMVHRDGDPMAMLSAQRTELNDGKPIQTSGQWRYTVEFYPEGASQGQAAGLYCVIDIRVEAIITMFFMQPAPKPDWSAWA